jgi:hypothetical protein
MNVIPGIGWITQREYGCVMKQLRRPYSDMMSLRSELQDDAVLSYAVKGFGKYDVVSRMTCCVSALALHDAGLSYSASRKQDIGILGTNSHGCLESNLDFFEDFVANGRTLGRARFFAYTLPSIPVAEAAIYFKFRGPLLYMGFPEKQVPSLLRQSDRMILRGESAAMLAVSASEEDAQCFVLRREQDAPADRVLGLEEVIDVAERIASAEELIGPLTDIWREKNARGAPQADPRRKVTP